MDDDLLASNAAWRLIPLCRRYCLVRFEALPVQSVKDGVESSGTVLWAFGMLPDSQCEVLGAWPKSEPVTMGWEEVFDDLQLRGVERIGSVVSSELSLDAAALRRAYPRAVSLVVPATARVVSRTGRALSQGSVAAGPQFCHSVRVSLRQRMVQASEGAVRRLRSRVRLTVARHGLFSNPEAACSFVIGDLKRAEQKLLPFGAGVSVPVNSRSRHHLAESAG